MRISLNRDSKVPVYMQIFEQVRRQILTGELLPGFRLPPERKLAESIGVNRTTVLNAYRELKAEGLIGSRVGDGTCVLSCPEQLQNEDIQARKEPIWNQLLSRYAREASSTTVKDLLSLVGRSDLISFSAGIASPESSPIDAFIGIEKEIVEQKGDKALLYAPTEGFLSLREELCSLMQKRGVYCNAEEIMLISGSQQGIDLSARIFLDPGDIVVVEEPSYFPAIQAFSSIGASIMEVPVDNQGMNIDILRQLLERYRPKLIYTIPTFHNPTGFEMTLKRRKQLIELAQKYSVLILEDDAYGDLRYEGHAMPLVKSMDNDGYVIYLSTFSKNIYSGLRLGWITAHKRVIQKFSAAKQIVDLHSSSLSQWIVERFIKNGSFDTHLNTICQEYRRRRDMMQDALMRFAPPGLRWNIPRGGFYIWCELPEGVLSSELVLKAAERKVALLPGNLFFLSGDGEGYFRLNFTYAALKDIETGVYRICESIRELMNVQNAPDAPVGIDAIPIF